MSEEVVQPAFPAKMVFEKAKAIKPFIDFMGAAKRGEYWATVVCVFLPLVVAIQITNEILVQILPVQLFVFLAIVLGAVAPLVLAPVLTRRLNDLGLSPWIAGGIMMAGSLQMSFYVMARLGDPTAQTLGGLAGLGFLAGMITFGCLPSKTATVPTFELIKKVGIVTASVAGGGVLLALIEAFV